MDPKRADSVLEKPPSWIVAGLTAFVVGNCVFLTALHWERETRLFTLIPAIAEQMAVTLATCAALGSAVVSGSVAFQYFERNVPEKALVLPTRDEFMRKLDDIERSERS